MFLCNEPVHMPNISLDIGGLFEIDIFDIKLNSPEIEECTNSERRLALHRKSSGEYIPQKVYAFKPSPFLRSLVCYSEGYLPSLVDSRLLRVLDVLGFYYSTDILQLINSRYLKFVFEDDELPSSICMFWNLQTLVVSSAHDNDIVHAPSEIWKMPQLRHVIISNGFYLPDPCVSETDEQCDFVLENLRTLSLVIDFQFTEAVLKKIPNIVKLRLRYGDEDDAKESSYYCRKNVGHLKKLQSLYCDFGYIDRLMDMDEFPLSLRRLTLCYVVVSMEEITTKIGPLPHLEKLKLVACSVGEEWNPVEGHFLNLKFLEIGSNYDLECWTAESIHFPRLEHLVLSYVNCLKEIPSGIGDIPTLRSIKLNFCPDCVVASAMTILEDQKSYGNEDLSLWVDGKPAKTTTTVMDLLSE